VGRRGELAQLSTWLNDPVRRLVTITGAGGSGKTRLAIEAVRSAAPCFDDSAAFVRLDSGEPAWLDRIAPAVRGKDLLLVLDSFEHVMKDRSRLMRLLEENPRLVALLTSRLPLGVPGESVLRLDGLPAPPPEKEREAEQFGAVELFLRSARQAVAGFDLDPADKAAVSAICRLVDGLPLAINLAAAWVGTLPCREILVEIQRGIDILASPGDRGDTPSSVRIVFDQSMRLLTPAERHAFARLSVFRGGFDREAALKVAGADLPVLAGLVNKSFVHRESRERYSLHDLFRQYGEEQLGAAGEHDDACREHMNYYRAGAETRQPDVGAPASFESFHWLIREQPNLSAALAWARQKDPEAATRLEKWMRPDLHGYGVHMWAPAKEEPARG
jgi:predicted ATPase